MNQSIPGATTILAPLEILNNPDLPVADTHHIQGGGWSQPDTAARNQIPMALRMADVTTCYVEADQTTYVLRGGIANTNWQPVGQSATGGGYGVAQFLDALQLVVGQQVDRELPDGLFTEPLSTLNAQNLPDGLSLALVSNRYRIRGSVGAGGSGLLVLNATLATGHKVQYVFAWASTAAAAQNVTTTGVVAVDAVFTATAGGGDTNIIYDYDVALVMNEPGLAEDGQRAVPGQSNSRFIGANTVADCIAVAAIAKQVVPSNAPLRFYRFAMSVAKLRQLYPNKTSVRFDIRAKRKAGNPGGVGNLLIFRVGRDLTAGLVAATQPIGFVSANPTPAPGSPTDYTLGSTGYGVTNTEQLIAYLTIRLSDGSAEWTSIGTIPLPDENTPPVQTEQLIIMGDAVEFDLAGGNNTPPAGGVTQLIVMGDAVEFDLV